jgi:hypothetical protein
MYGASAAFGRAMRGGVAPRTAAVAHGVLFGESSTQLSPAPSGAAFT